MAAANERLLTRHLPDDLPNLLALLTPAVLDLGDNPYRDEVYKTLGPRDQHAYTRAADDVTEAQRKRRFLIQAICRAIALHDEGEQKLLSLLSPKVADYLRDQIALALLRWPSVPPLPSSSPCSTEALEAVAGLLGESEPHLVARAVAAIFRLAPAEAFDRIEAVLPDPQRPTAAAIARFNELTFAIPDGGRVTDRRWVRAILPLMRFTYHADIALERLGASEGKVAEKRALVGSIVAPQQDGSVPPPQRTSTPSAPPPPPAAPPPEVSLEEQQKALEGELRTARLLGKGRKLVAQAIRLWPTRAGADYDGPVGATRFGGVPDLEAGQPWPTHEGRPLEFLAQVALHDVAELDADGILPNGGLLSFFVDASFTASGADRYLGSSCVLFFEDGAALAPASAPDGVALHPVCTVVAYPLLQLPPPDHPALVAALDDKQLARYIEKVHVPPPEGHQLLGYRDRVSKERPPEGSRLLFQCITDPTTGTKWGEGVHLDFWIEKKALKKRKLDQAVTRHGDG